MGSFDKTFRTMFYKNTIYFVDELMIRIIFVVDILRENAHSRKFWVQWSKYCLHIETKIVLLAKK